MGSIYKRSFRSGTRYYINYVDDHGRRVREALGSITRKEADSILKSRLGDVEKAKYGLVTPARRTRILFSDFANERFLPEYMQNSKPSSYRTCHCVFEAYIVPFFQGMYLDEITADHIEEYKRTRSTAISKNSARRRDGLRKAVSKSTVNKELRLLKYLFNYAWKRDYIANNPAKQIRQFRTPEKEPRFLTAEEIEKFVAACESIDPVKRIAFITGLHTGMRLSELCNLEWQNLDFENRQIHVTSKESWATKNYKSRVIPMTEVLYQELTRHYLRFRKRGEYCFCHPDGTRYSDLRGTLGKVARAAGLERFTMHTLRHTFASHLVMSGEPLPAVQKLMGHSTITTTMIYAHLAKGYLFNSVASLKYGRRDVTQASLGAIPGRKEAARESV